MWPLWRAAAGWWVVSRLTGRSHPWEGRGAAAAEVMATRSSRRYKYACVYLLPLEEAVPAVAQGLVCTAKSYYIQLLLA